MAEIVVWLHMGLYDFEFVPKYMKPVFASEKLIEIDLEDLDDLEYQRETYGWCSAHMQQRLMELYNG